MHIGRTSMLGYNARRYRVLQVPGSRYRTHSFWAKANKMASPIPITIFSGVIALMCALRLATDPSIMRYTGTGILFGCSKS